MQMKDRNNRHKQERNLLQLLAGIINYVSFDYRTKSSDVENVLEILL